MLEELYVWDGKPNRDIDLLVHNYLLDPEKIPFKYRFSNSHFMEENKDIIFLDFSSEDDDVQQSLTELFEEIYVISLPRYTSNVDLIFKLIEEKVNCVTYSIFKENKEVTCTLTLEMGEEDYQPVVSPRYETIQKAVLVAFIGAYNYVKSNRKT